MDKKDDVDEKCSSVGTVAKVIIVLYILFKIFSMVLAGYLSWNCGLNDLNPVRVFKTSLSVVFSELYLLYFFVNSVIMGNSC